MVSIAIVLVSLVGGYLLGSIPTAVWVGRRFYGVDVREHGSRNAGATNTIRVLGLRAGLFVFVIDVSKGFGAVSLSYLAREELVGDTWWMFFRIGLGVSAFLGHLLPVFAQFRGGKGVATLLGVVLALSPWSALSALGLFFVVLALTRYVSLGSMLAGISFPIFCYFVYGERNVVLLGFAVCMALLLLLTHRANIVRLMRGSESRFAPGRKGSVGKVV